MGSRQPYGHHRPYNYRPDAHYSRRGHGPGPWQDQYRYYNGEGYSSGYGNYGGWSDHADYRGDYGYGMGQAHAEPYASYTRRDHEPRYESGPSSQAYGEYYHQPAPYFEGHREGYQEYTPYGYGGNDMVYSHQGSEAQHFDGSYGAVYHEPVHYDHTQYSEHSNYHSHAPERRDRSRERRASPPPPPPLIEPPRPPSPAYLELANKDPVHLDAPDQVRKLLILDLNGTLVFRTAYRPKNRHAQQDHTAREAQSTAGDARDGSSSGAYPQPRLRNAHPRPYMSAFRDFLFAPETRKWLDVMVWSSAQPHSVKGMVERVFGEDVYAEATGERAEGCSGGRLEERAPGNAKPRLLAIWARDTLGLSDSHYSTFYVLRNTSSICLPFAPTFSFAD